MAEIHAACEEISERTERIERALMWVWFSVAMTIKVIFWFVGGLVLHLSLRQMLLLGGVWIVCDLIANKAWRKARHKSLEGVLNYEFIGWEPDKDNEKTTHTANPALEVRYSAEGHPVIVRKKLTPEQQVVMDRVVDLLKRTVWGNPH